VLDRFAKMKYTIKHRRAFRDIEKKYLFKTPFMWRIHDLDKLIMYPFLGVKLTSFIHRKFSRHHVNSIRKDKNWLEIIIDWECARYTKPDKPLNAYETLLKYYPEVTDEVLPILEGLGLDSYRNKEES